MSNESTATLQEAPAVGRDGRVDTIGMMGELARPFDKDLRTAVKLRMGERGLEEVAGDYFTGTLQTPPPAGTIDPARWLKLYEAKSITKAQFLSALSVGKERARQVVGEQVIERLSTFEPSTPKLVVARIKGVKIDVADALRELTRAALA